MRRTGAPVVLLLLLVAAGCGEGDSPRPTLGPPAGDTTAESGVDELAGEAAEANGDDDGARDKPAEPRRRKRPASAATPRERRAIELRLRDLVRRTGARDGSICTQLFTSRHVQLLSGLTGRDAVERCRAGIEAVPPGLQLAEIHAIEVRDARHGVVDFSVSLAGQTQRQTFQVKKVRGRWLFDGAAGGG